MDEIRPTGQKDEPWSDKMTKHTIIKCKIRRVSSVI